jgi:recombinational DNA repair protein RecR
MIKKINCEVILEDDEAPIDCSAPTIEMVIEKLGAVERKLEKECHDCRASDPDDACSVCSPEEGSLNPNKD